MLWILCAYLGSSCRPRMWVPIDIDHDDLLLVSFLLLSSLPCHRKMSAAGVSGHGLPSLDDVLTQITIHAPNLSSYLKTFAPKEVRETILASTLGSGQDPLSVLDPHRNTLGYLYILYVRHSILQRSLRRRITGNIVLHDCTQPPTRTLLQMCFQTQ